MDPIVLRRRLIESLKALAMPWDKQITLFPEYACIADEIGMLLGDSVLLLGESDEVRQSLAAELDRVNALDEFLDSLSNSKESYFWSVDGLRDDPRWEEIRTRAKSILNGLGEVNESAVIDWLTFIPTQETNPNNL